MSSVRSLIAFFTYKRVETSPTSTTPQTAALCMNAHQFPFIWVWTGASVVVVKVPAACDDHVKAAHHDSAAAPQLPPHPPFNFNWWALLKRGCLSEQSDRSSERATEDMAHDLITESAEEPDLRTAQAEVTSLRNGTTRWKHRMKKKTLKCFRPSFCKSHLTASLWLLPLVNSIFKQSLWEIVVL